ncbi:hypothetical protein WMW72_05125 [Paenibacillus filicis]|uniref:Uncharacterized protein n=1 Tax=Paenibacillus filicis TaxID=669464 RepID=A0ABU9DG91_9BACL
MDGSEEREQLRLKLLAAEKQLQAAEEDYQLFLEQLETYRRTIEEQKNVISAIRLRMHGPIQ